MVKENERTKYDLEKMPAPLFPPSFDKLSGSTGARIVDAATGEATVEGVVGPSSPTLFSAAGTLFVFVTFIVWGIMIIVAYYTHLPTINEQTVDVGADFEAPFPDFAVVLNLKPEDFYVANQVRQIKAADGALTWSDAEKEAEERWGLLSEDEQDFYKAVENRTLEFLWPVFRWEKITNGFSNKKDVHILLGPEDGLRFGDDCGLSASKNLAYSRWPVFCLRNSLAKEPRKLRGRDFGDPRWNYLDVRTIRCTNMSDLPRATDLFTNVSMPFPEAWSGTCAPRGDIDELVDQSYGLAVNLFFKLPSDPDWYESRWNKRAQKTPAEKHGMVNGGWTNHVYERLASNSHLACRLFLKHTEAYVNRPWIRKKQDSIKHYKSWFDYDRRECTRSYADDPRYKTHTTIMRPAHWTPSQENRTRFFDISVSLNYKRRKIEVRHQYVLEMLSEISGNWEGSLFLGWLIVVVINHALKAASAAPRSREEAKDLAKAVWAGTCGRGAPGAAPKVAPAKAPAPVPAAEPAQAPAADAAAAPAPAAEAPVSPGETPAAKRWKFLAMNWKSLKRHMQSANYFQLLNSAPPEAPAPPPLDPRKFAELLERVKKLEEQVRNS